MELLAAILVEIGTLSAGIVYLRSQIKEVKEDVKDIRGRLNGDNGICVQVARIDERVNGLLKEDRTYK